MAGNDNVLESIVGSRVWLREAPVLSEQAEGHQERQAKGLAEDVTHPPVEAVVEIATSKALRLDSEDPRILEMADRRVALEKQGAGGLLRIIGTLEVVASEPPYVVIMHLWAPMDPVAVIQRREWVRVRTQLDVIVRLKRPRNDSKDSAVETGPSKAIETLTALTEDLSGGGARLSRAQGLRTGDDIILEIGLPRGSVVVEGEVIHADGSGMARVKFRSITESAARQITRHVFDVQMQHRRRTTPSQPS